MLAVRGNLTLINVSITGGWSVAEELPPPETDLEAYAATLERFAALRPRRLLLTHFGERGETHDLHRCRRAGHLDRVAETVIKQIATDVANERIDCSRIDSSGGP